VLSYKTFFTWLEISLYQGLSVSARPFWIRLLISFGASFGVGSAIMIMSLILFENEFLNIVSISFTALILNELIMVALEITIWYDHPGLVGRQADPRESPQARLHGHCGDRHATAVCCQHCFLTRVFRYVFRLFLK